MDTAPNVFINPQMPPPVRKGLTFNLKYVFIFLGIVIVAEVIFGLKTIFLPEKTLPSNVASQPASTNIQTPISPKSEVYGRMTLTSPQKGYKVGDTIAVTITLDTSGKAVDGIDAVLKFDPKVLDSASSTVTAGTIFPDYPVAKITPEGVVRITALTSLQGQGFSGSGILATINFKAKSVGTAPITWDFTPGATNDSNIFGAGVEGDMLKEVGNLEITIR